MKGKDAPESVLDMTLNHLMVTFRMWANKWLGQTELLEIELFDLLTVFKQMTDV